MLPREKMLRASTIALLMAACVGDADSRRTRPDSATPDSATPVAADSSPPDRSQPLNAGFKFATRDSLVRRLGPPDSVTAEIVPNRHDPGVRDTLYTMHYADFVAMLHHPGGGRDIFSRAVVSHDRHLRIPLIGRPVAEVQRLFGPPDSRTDSSMTYSCIGCSEVEDPVELVIARGRVARVYLHYYVD